MHKCSYTDRIEIQNKKITRIIKASYNDKSVEVFKENEKSQYLSRYLYYYNICGYLVEFPGEIEKHKYTSGSYTVKRTPYYKAKVKPNLYIINKPSKTDVEKILQLHPNFKYVLDKVKVNSNAKLMEILQIWLQHKEIEFLFALKLNQLAFNKSFYSLKNETRKQVLRFYKQNKNNKYLYSLPLQTVQIIVKNKIPTNEIKSFIEFSDITKIKNYKTYLYLKKKTLENEDLFENAILYKDYLSLLKKTKHSLKEDYWKYPKDIREWHNRIHEEINLEIRAKELARLEEEKINNKIEKNKLYYYKKVIKRFEEINSSDFKGYEIFIPQTIKEWIKQAEVLNQCILRCGYLNKVIKQKSLLIFVQKNGTPIATVEVNSNAEIIQEYADEFDRTNCKPSEEVKNIVREWIKERPSLKWEMPSPTLSNVA